MSHIGLSNVQQVYSGPEGDLWELIMGEQIHIGGLQSSMDLADRAGIKGGMFGVDLCCCNGAGMRYLVHFREVAGMVGVDATEKVIERGQRRCRESGLDGKIRFILGDVCSSGLPSESADFVWGEDAWCYVVNKDVLISEAARIVRLGGTIAFTDWIEGPKGLNEEQARRLFTFMKFPNMQDLAGYRELLESTGCEVLIAEDTGRFSPHVDLYLNMLNMQLTYDALKIIGFNREMMNSMGREMIFLRELAHNGNIMQGIFVAKKTSSRT